MAISGRHFATWAVLCTGVLLLGTTVGFAQEENELTPPVSESPFSDDAAEPQREDTPYGQRDLAPEVKREDAMQELTEPGPNELPPQDEFTDRSSESMRSGVNCPTEEELKEWFKPLSRIQLSRRPAEGRMPIDCSTQLFYSPTDQGVDGAPQRNWATTEYNWIASNLAHQPTYWDDVPLERYGQTISPVFQPGISGAKFFLTFPIIPYKIGVNRTHDLIYTLGYYRPGSPTPAVRQTLPFEWDAVAFEALAVTGMVFILP